MSSGIRKFGIGEIVTLKPDNEQRAAGIFHGMISGKVLNYELHRGERSGKKIWVYQLDIEPDRWIPQFAFHVK